MDVETTHAIEELGSRIDRLETSLRQDIKTLGDELRGEMAELRTEMRDEMAELQTKLRGEVATVRDDIALNWSRTQLLFEAVRDDIKLLGEANGRRSRKKPRR